MPETVLIADDDPVSRGILQRALRKYGYEVQAVVDGEAAWERLEAPDAPALVILDWMMPGLDGPEVCRRVRARPTRGRSYTYLLLLTGRDAKTDIVEGLAAGADDYVVKPFAPAEIDARLRVGRRILALEADLRAERAAADHAARHDVLTGVWNRRSVLEHLRRELGRELRQGGCLGVLLLDVDHFKRVNDTHGHLVGDEVLALAAQRLQRSLRTYDGLGRYGGEEFLAITPCRDPSEVLLVATRLREALGATPFETSAGALSITVSVGASTSLACGTDERALLAAADEALYGAKRAGRNCVVVATGPAAEHACTVPAARSEVAPVR